MVYLIALLLAIIGIYLNDKVTPAIRKTYLVLLCLYVILIIGFRYKVGMDTISYMNAFKKIPTLDSFFSNTTFQRNRFEPGFLFLCSACKTIANEFWPIQMIMATISTSCIFIFLNRYCRNVFIGLAFFFIIHWLYFSTEIMRESASVGIFLLNYKNLQEKNWVRYYLFSIFSIMFHYSAIIIWFFPFAKWLKPNLFFIFICICFLGITPLVEKLNEMLQIAAISGRIDQYVAGAEALNLNWRLGELIRSGGPAIAVAILFRMYKLELPMRHMILLQIIFCMGAFAIPIIFSRFINYTCMFVTVAIANACTFQQIKVWLKICFISFILLTQSYYLYSMYNAWVPYVSIFYPENLPIRNQMYRHFFLNWK